MSTPIEPTWKPHDEHGRLGRQSDLPDTVFAFPRQRKEPLTDAQHVRNAIARFGQVIDVCDEDRDLAFANIEKAARYYGVDLAENDWRELGLHPQQSGKPVRGGGDRGERPRPPQGMPVQDFALFTEAPSSPNGM